MTSNLGREFVQLRGRWRAGERNRELALHLFFLAWYVNLEPPHLTGLDSSVPVEELIATANDVHAWLLPNGASSNDIEALYVTGLPAQMFPWVLGDVDEWSARAELYRARYRELAPQGIDPKIFQDRGEYGEYFASQAVVAGGF